QIFNTERGGDVSRDLTFTNSPACGKFGCCCSRGHRMTVDKRSEETTVNKSRHSDVVGRRREVSNDLISINKALQLMPLRIVSATAKAVRKIVGIEILNCSAYALGLVSSIRHIGPPI